MRQSDLRLSRLSFRLLLTENGALQKRLTQQPVVSFSTGRPGDPLQILALHVPMNQDDPSIVLWMQTASALTLDANNLISSKVLEV